jgi:hypothetical protein
MLSESILNFVIVSSTISEAFLTIIKGTFTEGAFRLHGVRNSIKTSSDY